MILKRKIYEKLKERKLETNGKRTLLIEGARRIGKSTIAKEFAKNEYKSYILIDFANVSSFTIQIFENYRHKLDDFFLLLQSEYNTKLYKRESVIIFDEIQRYPKAREFIKYLVEDGRYDYIETGSLIFIKENVKDIVIPSEERSVKMYPLDFEEFCLALNEELLIDYIKNCFNKLTPLDRNMHEKAMFLFKQYILIGGMPQSVMAYILNNKDFEASDKEKRDIINLYRNDILKINDRYKSKVLSIFDQIPGFLSKHEKRVILDRASTSSSIDQYTETFFWLGNSMICNECFLTKDPNVGLALNEDRTFIKCYMGDTGLLFSHAFSENEIVDANLYKQILQDKLSLNKGMLYENVIAQMLTSNGHKLYFYTHYNDILHRNDIEIDFIISNNSKLQYKINPIEVKSTKRYKISSLQKFKEKYKERIGTSYVIHPKNLEVDGDIIYLPAYMTFCLN